MKTLIELADLSEAKLEEKTKKELIEFAEEQNCFYKKIATAAVEIGNAKQALEEECKTLSAKLAKSEEYNEQARAMLNAVMERWYHYED